MASHQKIYLVVFGLLNKMSMIKQIEEKINFPDELKICAKGQSICIPANYSKFDLPNEDDQTLVSVGIDIKDIPNINDHEFSVTLNAFFVVRFVVN